MMHSKSPYLTSPFAPPNRSARSEIKHTGVLKSHQKKPHNLGIIPVDLHKM